MEKGFTLVEVLVSIVIFSIVVTSFFGVFTSAFQEQRKNLDLQYLLQNTSYIAEYMSRALRMARKDMAGDCLPAKGNFVLLAQDHIKFLNHHEECQEFYLEDGAVKVKKEGIAQPLTPANLVVENLRFRVEGEDQTDDLQPKLTFVLKLKIQAGQPQTLNLQSTISQRELDVQY